MYFYGMTPEEAHDNYIEERAYKRGYEDAKKEFDRPHGEWISFDAKRDRCSMCDFKIGKYVGVFYRFCPNCGADMRKEGEAE